MRNFILKHEKRILRVLEILPGFFSWNVILFPYWGVFVFPNLVAYFILAFNIYWFYQSFTIAITSFVSHIRMQASMRYDWVKEVSEFPDWKKVHHAVIIPTYKEPIHILQRTFDSIKAQTLPLKQISIILATEDAEPEEQRESKISELRKNYGKIFANIFVTVHTLKDGEMRGKASNERCAAVWFKENVIDKKGIDINYTVVTSCDADHKYHPNHFANLTYGFLDNPKRYLTFWQPAILFYNNIWELPAITRVPNTLGSIWNLSQLPRTDRLISQQNYSLSFKLLHEVDYWDADKIPEDWGIFFKAFYKKKGEIEVEPIYLPLFADAAQSTSFIKTVKNQYEQYKRWAWGVSDDPWIIKEFFLNNDIPFFKKTTRVMWALWAHFSWPISWFIITIGLTLPSLLNPRFARTTLGYTIPKMSSLILTVSLVFLVFMLIFDYIYRPPRPKEVSVWRAVLIPFEFILMPIVGFFFSALPGLDAHTRLMLGKYIQYKVTEKV